MKHTPGPLLVPGEVDLVTVSRRSLTVAASSGGSFRRTSRVPGSEGAAAQAALPAKDSSTLCISLFVCEMGRCDLLHRARGRLRTRLRAPEGEDSVTGGGPQATSRGGQGPPVWLSNCSWAVVTKHYNLQASNNIYSHSSGGLHHPAAVLPASPRESPLSNTTAMSH